MQGGVCPGGVSGGYAGGCVQGVVHNPLDPEADTPLPREQMTNTCKNITLP